MNDETSSTDLIRFDDRRLDISGTGMKIADTLSSSWQRLRRWRIEKRAIRHLESLEDHRLDDIGIERSQITAAVRGLLERREILSRSGSDCRVTDACHRLAA